MLPPGVDTQHPRGLLHHAGWRGAGGAQHVADVLVDFLGLTAPVTRARHRAIGVVRDLAGQVEQAPAVDDHALIEISAVLFHVVFFQQRLALRGAGEIDHQLHLDEHGGVSQATHDQTRRRRAGAPEELRALRATAGVVGVGRDLAMSFGVAVREIGAAGANPRPAERDCLGCQHSAEREKHLGNPE